jgi:hypothetical protein
MTATGLRTDAGGCAAHDRTHHQSDRSDVAAVAAPADGGRRRQLRLRHLWVVPGLAIAVYASTLSQQHGLGIVPLLVFTIVPDVPRLLGLGQPHRKGQLAARAVPLFNLLHHPVPPLALLGLAAAGILPPLWLVGGIAWLGHLVIGLAIGDRLRTRDGYLRSRWLVDQRPAAGTGLELARETR